MTPKTPPPDFVVHQLIARAVTDPAAVVSGPLALPVNPVTGQTPDPSADGTWLGAAALAALNQAGYQVVPAGIQESDLPEDSDYFAAYAGGQHAVRREAIRGGAGPDGGSLVARTLCGQLAVPAPVRYDGDTGSLLHDCLECAWRAAFSRGTTAAQARRLTPASGEREILARHMPDPLIAPSTAARFLALADAGALEPGHPALVQVLATITRHRPVIAMSESCSDGECGHIPGDAEPGTVCPSPDATVICGGCTLHAGGWAGEREGQLFPACTIPAPCAVLTSLAEYAAEKTGEEARA